MRQSRIYLMIAILCLMMCSAVQLRAMQEKDALLEKSAPEFSLPAHTGGNIALKNYTGKQTVVLAFYPKDFTGG